MNFCHLSPRGAAQKFRIRCAFLLTKTVYVYYLPDKLFAEDRSFVDRAMMDHGQQLGVKVKVHNHKESLRFSSLINVKLVVIIMHYLLDLYTRRH